MKLKQKDRLLGTLSILFAMVFGFFTSRLPATGFVGDPGPKMFPYMGSIICALCGLILIIKPGKGAGKTFLNKDQFIHAAILFGLYTLYFLLMWFVGFAVAAPIVLFLISLLFSEVSNPNASLKSRMIKCAIYAILLSAALYFIYAVALKTTIPAGLLSRLLK